MTQDEIIRMARKAGFEVVDGKLRLYFDGSKALLKPNYTGTVVDGLKKFAALVAAHVAERCAKSCEELINEETCYVWIPDAKGAVNKCVETIRSIGEKPVTVPANGLLAQEPSRDAPTDSQDGNIVSDHSGDIANLVKAAVLAEREACAKLVETTHAKGLQSIREACAATIRARGE